MHTIHPSKHACIHKHTYIHTYIHIHTDHTYIHTYMHACIHSYIHTYRGAVQESSSHTYIHSYIYTYIHTCRGAVQESSSHTYLHTFIHTYIHTGGQSRNLPACRCRLCRLQDAHVCLVTQLFAIQRCDLEHACVRVCICRYIVPMSVWSRNYSLYKGAI